MSLGQRADLGDRVQDAARGLAMHGEHVSDARVGSQHAIDRLEVGRRILGRLVHGDSRARRSRRSGCARWP